MQQEDVKIVEIAFNDEIRQTISLNGLWKCAVGKYDDTVAPTSFDATIPVPGLWDMASKNLGDYSDCSLWYKKTLVFNNRIPKGKKVVLHINKAYYGRTIFVNNRLAGEYPYNFTASDFDITEFIQEGENELVIKLGTFERAMEDPLNPAHVGFDLEKRKYYSGIVDDISLCVYGNPSIERLQTAPDITNGKLRVKTALTNTSNNDVLSDVEVSIYELGICNRGVSEKEELLDTVVIKDVVVPAKGEYIFDQIFDVRNFNKTEKAWCPNNPYLYRLVIKTNGDEKQCRFGMRTFTFDHETGKALLNGDVHYLRGTNICINRFYEDPLRDDHPWDEEWVRKLFDEFQSVNWECARFCIGFPPEFWYDICDEIGFMVADEYPYWTIDFDAKYNRKTADLITEYTSWIYERNNHTCVIFWDAQNESNKPDDIIITADIIQSVRYIDLQERTWENGWGPVQDPHFPCEHHPYPFEKTDFSLEKIGTDEMFFYYNNDTKSNYINEYGWLWVTREGNPCHHSIPGYATGKRGKNNTEYKEFYATAVAQMTERYRASGRYVGIMQFCGLSYSIPERLKWTGYTSDVLEPDIKTPIIRKEWRDRMYSAFAPVGIVINDWKTSAKNGIAREVPVVIVNDTLDNREMAVTVELYKGYYYSECELLSTVKGMVQAAALSITEPTNFGVAIPEKLGMYSLVASYIDNNHKIVSSVRYLKVEK